MTVDIKKMFEEANDAYEKERGSIENTALREIIKIERDNYYNKNISQARLKSIREIISNCSATGKSNDSSKR